MHVRGLVPPRKKMLHVDKAVLLVFSFAVVAPWMVLIFITKHEEGCPAAAKEAAVLYNPVVHAALVIAYAGPPWFTLANMAAKAAADLGGFDALAHRRLQWIIVSRLLPVWAWLYAFLYNYRHDDLPVFLACKLTRARVQVTTNKLIV